MKHIHTVFIPMANTLAHLTEPMTGLKGTKYIEAQASHIDLLVIVCEGKT